MTVLVSPLGLPSGLGADAVALSLALAAAAAGRRALLVETSAGGRIRAALMPDAEPDCLVEDGGALHRLDRFKAGDVVVAILSGELARAEAASAKGVLRRTGLAEFDTVIVAGAGIEADAGRQAERADLVLIAAPGDTAPADLGAAARRLQGTTGRPCGAVLVAPAPIRAVTEVEPPSARRRLAPEPVAVAPRSVRRPAVPVRRRLGA